MIVRVGIVDYDGWEDTLRCLQTLSRQTFRAFDVSIVFNGNVPPRVEFPTDLGFSLQQTINKENLGFAAGANQIIRGGLEDESIAFIWILNNDTRPDPDALEWLVEEGERNPRAGAVGSVLRQSALDSGIEAWGGGIVGRWTGLPQHLHSRNKVDYLCGAALLLRREALEDVGLFDESYFLYWEDTDLSFRLRRSGWELVVAENSCVVHESSASSGFQTPFYDYWFTRSSIRFLRRHFRFWPVPAGISSSGRLVRRIFTARWKNAASIIQACRHGLEDGPR